MNDQQKIEYLDNLMKSGGEGLEGVEAMIFMQFQEAQTNLRQVNERRNNLRNELQQAENLTGKITGQVEALANSLITFKIHDDSKKIPIPKKEVRKK
jgi:primosomal protein N''